MNCGLHVISEAWIKSGLWTKESEPKAGHRAIKTSRTQPNAHPSLEETCDPTNTKKGASGNRCHCPTEEVATSQIRFRLENVKAFSTKLMLWKAQLSEKKLHHFPACSCVVKEVIAFIREKYVDAVEKLQQKLKRGLQTSKYNRTICLFGSTCLCEKLVSTMTFNKSKYRSRLSDVHLQATLRFSTATSLSTNVAQLSEKERCQVSGSKY